MGYIFISYSHKDKAYVHKLQESLQNEGFDVWVDDRIDYGTTWPIVIQKHLDDCDAFIVVMTENAFESEWVQNEVTRARRKKKPFFGLLLRGDTWLSFEAIQYEDVSGEKLPKKKFYESLARVVQRKEEVSSSPVDSKKPLISKDESGRFSAALKAAFAKAFPFLGIIGIAIVIVSLLWGGFWAIPKFISLIPTTKTTATQYPVVRVTSTNPPVIPIKTPRPNATSTKTRTPAPTSLPTEITDAKGVQMELVPAGKFIMGSNNGDDGEKPVHTVYLDSFYIDKYEVTNAMYKACVDAGACQSPKQSNSDNRNSYFGNSQYDDYPVIYIDWYMSVTYCEWRGAKLPTEAQWEKAARGFDGRTFPWGESVDATYANYDTNYYPNLTNAVDSYKKGISPFGIYNMAGNVWEWVADWYSGSYYQNSPSTDPLGPSSGQYRVQRGGSWRSFYTDELRAFARLWADPGHFSSYIGFRCAY